MKFSLCLLITFGGVAVALSAVYAPKWHSHGDGGDYGNVGHHHSGVWGNGGGNSNSGGWDNNGGRDLRQEETNKKIVLAFYQEVLGDKNIDAADKYISAQQYIQHNPTVGDGLEAIKVAMREWFKGAAKTKTDVQHISAEGDLVWIHVRGVDSVTGKATSIIDIFKLKNGKIIEHWDVMQQVPDQSANSHPMF